mgnify:CR=1 FL=1
MVVGRQKPASHSLSSEQPPAAAPSLWQVSGVWQLSNAAMPGGSVVRHVVPAGQSSRRATNGSEESSQKR